MTPKNTKKGRGRPKKGAVDNSGRGRPKSSWVQKKATTQNSTTMTKQTKNANKKTVKNKTKTTNTQNKKGNTSHSSKTTTKPKNIQHTGFSHSKVGPKPRKNYRPLVIFIISLLLLIFAIYHAMFLSDKGNINFTDTMREKLTDNYQQPTGHIQEENNDIVTINTTENTVTDTNDTNRTDNITENTDTNIPEGDIESQDSNSTQQVTEQTNTGGQNNETNTKLENNKINNTPQAQGLINFYEAINQENYDTMRTLTDNYLQGTDTYRTYFADNRLTALLDATTDDNFIISNIKFVEQVPNKPYLEIYTYNITYTLKDTGETFEEQREVTMKDIGESTRIVGTIRCETSGCTFHPFFSTARYSISY